MKIKGEYFNCPKCGNHLYKIYYKFNKSDDRKNKTIKNYRYCIRCKKIKKIKDIKTKLKIKG